jgi:periplasmic divalent cation tolerance protein
MNLTGFGVVLLTASSQEEAQTIATVLVEEKLAGCVNITPVSSVYSWEGKINCDQEWQLIIKTDLSKFAQLEAKITELHSYTVPEIIALPIINGSHSYLNWLKSVTNE